MQDTQGLPFAIQLQIALYHKASTTPNHIRPILMSTRAAKRARYTREERKKNFGLFSQGISYHFARQVFEERKLDYHRNHNVARLVKAATLVNRSKVNNHA